MPAEKPKGQIGPIIKNNSKIDEPDLKCGVHPRNAAFTAALLHLFVMCVAFIGELVLTYYDMVEKYHDHPGLDPVVGIALTILAFMASASLMKGIHEENPLYILVWLLYSAYEFALLLSVLINSTFRLCLHSHTEIFTIAIEAATLVLLALMFIIHYFVVDYYRQLVNFNEKERLGENNRLRQVSAWLRNFPGRDNNSNAQQCKCDDGRSAVTRRIRVATNTSRVHQFDGTNQLSPASADTMDMDEDRVGSPDPSIYDCDDPPHRNIGPGVEVARDGTRMLPPIIDNSPSISGSNIHDMAQRRRDPDAESWN